MFLFSMLCASIWWVSLVKQVSCCCPVGDLRWSCRPGASSCEQKKTLKKVRESVCLYKLALYRVAVASILSMDTDSDQSQAVFQDKDNVCPFLQLQITWLLTITGFITKTVFIPDCNMASGRFATLYEPEQVTLCKSVIETIETLTKCEFYSRDEVLHRSCKHVYINIKQALLRT